MEDSKITLDLRELKCQTIMSIANDLGCNIKYPEVNKNKYFQKAVKEGKNDNERLKLIEKDQDRIIEEFDKRFADYLDEKSFDEVMADLSKRKKEMNESLAEEIAIARDDVVDALDYYMELLTGHEMSADDRKFMDDQFLNMEKTIKKLNGVLDECGDAKSNKTTDAEWEKIAKEFLKSVM